MAKRIIKETPLDKGNRPAIDLPTGGKMEFPEPAKLIEETIEFDAAETVLLNQLVKDKAAQQPQEVQQVQPSSSGKQPTGDLSAILEKNAAAIDSFLKEPVIAQQEELQRLTQLPLSQIEELPQEKRELVLQEMARQIVETPGFVDTMTAITAASKKAMKSFAEWATKPAGEWERTLLQMAESANRTISSVSAAMESIKKSIAKQLSDDTQEALKTWAILAPYMKAEADENPELYDNPETPATALIAAAARRARADGKEIPPLKAEEEPEQMQMQLELPTEKEDEADKEGKPQGAESAPLAMARNAGAITTLGNHVATIADSMLQFCFTSNDLKALPGDHEKFKFDKAGKLNEISLNGQPLQPLDDIHTGFLMALLQLANLSDIREYNSMDNPAIAVYLPAFFRETNIDPRPREHDKQTKELKKRQKPTDQTLIKRLRAQRFIEFMKPLDNRVGIIEGEGYYTVARFLRWDEKTDTAYIAIPFEIKLAEIARLHADNHSAISTVFHADILTENQTAVELANRIAVGLIERGVTRADSSTYQNQRKPIKKKTTRTAADGTKTVEELTFAPEPETTVTKSRTDENGITTTITGTQKKKRTFTYSVKFATLIADCPGLQRELEEIRNGQGAAEKAARDSKKKAEEIAAARRSDHKNDSQRINKKLKDTFTAAIRIIMEKSDIPQYYSEIAVKTARLDAFKAPTNSTLNEYLTISHSGKNPNFAG